MTSKLLFFLAILFSFSINAQIDFEAHITVNDTGGTNNPYSVFAADIDGDGFIDILSASRNDDKIAWYKNIDGLGTFGPQQIISETALGAESVFAADIDGDGDNDVIFASRIDDTIGWYENTNGLGSFGPKQIISNLVDSPNSISAGDIDNDGDIDILSSSDGDDKIAWYENTDGLGNYGPQQIISTNFSAPLKTTTGDIDGDGDLDILSGSGFIENSVVWFKNTNGQGNFVAQQILTDQVQRAGDAILADVDNDGDLDIVVASKNFNGHRVIWFENTDGQGNFSTSSNEIGSDNVGAPEALVAADFDNDGYLDIAVGATYSGISWYKNNGDGTFGTYQMIDEIYGTTNLFVADINADGAMDLLMTSSTEDMVAWYKNTNGQGSFGPANELAPINSANGIYSIFSADLDGDGDKDILAALYDDNRIVWQENLDGLGTFSELKTIANVEKPISVYAGDMDGDGDVDVIAAYRTKLVWFKNEDGQANFGNELIINNAPYNLQDVVYATDIDNDGDLDIFGSEGYNTYWQENTNGFGTFGPIQIISDDFAASDSMKAEDIDNDGDKDLVVSYWAEGVIVWFENIDGQGTFGNSNLIDTLISPESVEIADIDNDGDNDIIISEFGNGEILLYKNDGLGNFGSAITISSSVLGAFDVKAADFDNDGDIDVVCADFRDRKLIWIENDGNGNFNYPQTIASDLRTIFCVFPDDFNNDGKMDILTAIRGKDEIIWFENKGPLGIEENTTNLFSLYPNPTNGLLNIKSNTSISEVSIYNNLGQLLIASEEKNQVDVSVFSEGIYFVKIKDENGRIETKKVMKE